MGISLGKWIKCTLFRKKKSKPVSSKPGVIPEPLNSLVIQPSFISDPTLVTVAGLYEKAKLEPKCGEVTESFTAQPTLASLKQDNDARTITKSGIPNEYEKHVLEQAARRIQATFRCYRARREFHTLKSIIRLQAVIRGDLVRRWAVSNTTCSTSSFASDFPCWPEDDTEKQRRKQWKLPRSPLHLFSGLKIINPSEAIRAIEGEPPCSIKEDKRHMRFPAGDDPSCYLGNHAVTDAQDKQFSLVNESKYTKEDWFGNENQKTVNIRGSLPTKHGDQAMGKHRRKVQTRTTATAPTHAKMKGQASPRLGQEVAGNSVVTRRFWEDVANDSVMTRRHSLPSTDNKKPNAPPNIQWLGTKVKVKRKASSRFGKDVADNSFITRRYSLPSSDNGKSNAFEASRIGEQILGKYQPSSRGSNGKIIQPKWKP